MVSHGFGLHLPNLMQKKKDVVHLSVYLLAICQSSLEKCLFNFLAYFKIGLFVYY